MRPSNAPSNVALYKNLESVVIAPHLLGKIPAKNCVKIAFVIAGALGVAVAAFGAACSADLSVAATARSMFERCMCGKPVTPPDNLGARQKEIGVPAEPFQKLDVSWPGIRGGGRDWNTIHSRILEDGRRMRAASKARHSRKGYAVETRAIGGDS